MTTADEIDCAGPALMVAATKSWLDDWKPVVCDGGYFPDTPNAMYIAAFEAGVRWAEEHPDGK